MKGRWRHTMILRRSLTFFLSVVIFLGAGSGRIAWAEPPRLETLYLMRLINEARTAPSAMLERAGLDVEAARAALGEDAWILDAGLPPLARNDYLMSSARAHVDDMVARLYYNTVTPEGLGPAERAAAAGYAPLAVTESLGLLGVVTFVPGFDAVWLIFRQWLELDLAAPPEGRRLFAVWPSDIGVEFRAVSVDLDGVRLNAYVAVADYAFPQVFQPMVVGAVRVSGATGPFVDPWILPPATTVQCRSEDGSLWWETFTDPLGGYQCPAVPGLWMTVEAARPEEGVVAAATIQGREIHQALDLFP